MDKSMQGASVYQCMPPDLRRKGGRSVVVPYVRVSVRPREGSRLSFPLPLHGSSSGSRQPLALINSHRRCPTMADKGPSSPPPHSRLLCNRRAHNKLSPSLALFPLLRHSGKPIKPVLKLRSDDNWASS